MSVTIRLSPVGKKNQAVYRVVVAKTRSKRNGKNLARLGFYNPNVKPAIFKLDKKAFADWLKKGALVSSGLRRLLDQEKKAKSEAK
ncbi:MAG TPA: 30S ribosomal protein S16 [Clostridia bacterium]|nr:30S ribosomal protein S16 [Clostridia bacterium]